MSFLNKITKGIKKDVKQYMNERERYKEAEHRAYVKERLKVSQRKGREKARGGGGGMMGGFFSPPSSAAPPMRKQEPLAAPLFSGSFSTRKKRR